MTGPAARRRAADIGGSSRARTTVSGVLFGVGLAAFIDEAVFHQLLHWHHFYDKSTPEMGLVSDGLFHAFGWFAVVASLFLLFDVRHRCGVWWTRWVAGLLLGAGGFELYDGTVQHKLLRLHQIRYHVNIVPYDLTRKFGDHREVSIAGLDL